jgi:hypothetical protein
VILDKLFKRFDSGKQPPKAVLGRNTSKTLSQCLKHSVQEVLQILHGLLNHTLGEHRVIQIEYGINIGWRQHEGGTLTNTVPISKAFQIENVGFLIPRLRITSSFCSHSL